MRPQARRRLRSRRGQTGAPQGVAEGLAALLESMGGTRERAGLQRLWDNWETALGDELAALALPLGHKAPRRAGAGNAGGGAILLLAAEDAMLLQELSLRSCEILERVNGFLGQAYFGEVKVSLALGRSAPVRSRAPAKAPARGVSGGGTLARGIYLEGMDQDSPVARCYARFVRRKKLLEKELGAPPEETGEKR